MKGVYPDGNQDGFRDRCSKKIRVNQLNESVDRSASFSQPRCPSVNPRNLRNLRIGLAAQPRRAIIAHHIHTTSPPWAAQRGHARARIRVPFDK